MEENNTIENISELELAIAGCENNCDGEIVVFIAGRSGPYSDVPLKIAIITTAVALFFLTFTTLSVSSVASLFMICGSFLAGSVVHQFWPELVVYLTSEKRQLNQVKSCGELTFVRQSVSLTRNRTGILIYLSLLEQKAELICDAGIRSKVPMDTLGELRKQLWEVAEQPDCERLLPSFIRELGEVLAEFVPPDETNPNELDNTPLYAGEVTPEK